MCCVRCGHDIKTGSRLWAGNLSLIIICFTKFSSLSSSIRASVSEWILYLCMYVYTSMNVCMSVCTTVCMYLCINRFMYVCKLSRMLIV